MKKETRVVSGRPKLAAWGAKAKRVHEILKIALCCGQLIQLAMAGLHYLS
ncbi:hypothetical protein [Amycolatopsis sp. NPDC004079]